MWQHIAILHSLVWLSNNPLMNIPHFVYSSVCRWAFGLFLPSDFHEEDRNTHSHTSLCVDILSHFSQVYPRGGMAGSHGTFMLNILRQS